MSAYCNNTGRLYADTTAGTPISVSGLPFTMACWIKFSDLTKLGGGGEIIMLADNGDGSAGMGADAARLYSTADPYMRIEARHTSSIYSTNTTSAAQDTWYHLAYVATNSTTFTLWVNGSSVGTAPGTRVIGAMSRIQMFGRYGGFEKIAGYMAYAAIWSTALSTGDITALQSTYPSAVSAASLIHYWPLDDAGGSTLRLTDEQGSADLTNDTGVTYVAWDGPTLTAGATAVAPARRAYSFLQNMA